MFKSGLHGVIKRAAVIGNGFAGAENQCVGLLRALGLSSRFSLYRVTRPIGVINKWLNWLPVSVHKRMDDAVGRICGDSRFSQGKKVMAAFAENGASGTGLLDVLEADAHQIAKMARDTFDRDGPLLVVASGRDTITVASSIRQLAPESVFVVQIQHPRLHLNRFDLVITPHHDYYPLTAEGQEQIPWFLRSWITPREPPGRNVVLTIGALHQADSAAMRTAASLWHDELAPLQKPLLVVNIGGPTRGFLRQSTIHVDIIGLSGAGDDSVITYTPGSPLSIKKGGRYVLCIISSDETCSGWWGWYRQMGDNCNKKGEFSFPGPGVGGGCGQLCEHRKFVWTVYCALERNCQYGEDFAKQLTEMLRNVLWSCGSIRISFSRRTPEKVSKVLLKEFSTNPKVYIWGGRGTNPHLGHLAWADAFVITADSVTMLSEACSTGKPVYVVGGELCMWKFVDFQKSLRERGVARPFTGKEDISESWSYPPLNDCAEAACMVMEAVAKRGWRIHN